MAAQAEAQACRIDTGSGTGWLARLNREWHKPALQVYTFIVLAHWAEHLVQGFQIWALGWPRPKALGLLGLWQPWLVSSEWMHYLYALVMIIGLFMLRPGFAGRSLLFWNIALVIQFWHHIEHAVLQGQALMHQNLMGSPVPVSFLQMLFPKSRVEIHLFYNTVVFVPMVIAMYYHMFPPAGEESGHGCSCAYHRQPAPRKPVTSPA